MIDLPAAAPDGIRCPACGSGGLIDVFSVTGLPVFVGHLADDPESARAAPRGDVTLAYCPNCAFVHNRDHDPSRVDFAPGYEVSLSHTPTFRAYIASVLDRLVERYALVGRRVLEIGCGDGYVLRELARRGIASAVGIDPTVPEPGREEVDGARIEWIRGYYDPRRYAHLDPDFVASLSVFEDIPEPAAFLRELRRVVRPEVRLYFEVYNAWHAFEHEETWSVHYEQCNLFGPHSLAGIFRRAGFEVLDSGTSYQGDQYAWVEAAPGSEPDRVPEPERSTGPTLPPDLARFAATHRADVQRWRDRFAEYAETGLCTVLWGSGGKGITFLNVVPGADVVAAVADINPDRQGRFIPGTGHPIVAPEALPGLEPDVVIVTNALYEDEIRAQAAELGLACSFEVA